jgi:catechol 2,3-dioxygenase
MHVERLGHLQIPVRNLTRAVRFYKDLLGLTPVPLEMPSTSAVLSAGPTHHEFILMELPADAFPAGHLSYRFGFKIGDTLQALQTAKNELRAAGAAILGSGQTALTKSLYVGDPDGNEIELYIDEHAESWANKPDALSHPILPLPL